MEDSFGDEIVRVLEVTLREGQISQGTKSRRLRVEADISAYVTTPDEHDIALHERRSIPSSYSSSFAVVSIGI